MDSLVGVCFFRSNSILCGFCMGICIIKFKCARVCVCEAWTKQSNMKGSDTWREMEPVLTWGQYCNCLAWCNSRIQGMAPQTLSFSMIKAHLEVSLNGVPLVIIHLNEFSLIKHPAIGVPVPPFQDPPICTTCASAGQCAQRKACSLCLTGRRSRAHGAELLWSLSNMDWLKGKPTGNHGFYICLPSNIGVSCKFSHHPILWLSNIVELTILCW